MSIDLITSNREQFFYFVDECNKCYRSGHDLRLYREIIELHRKNNDIIKIIEKEDLPELIRDTLVAWNMDQRGAKLNSTEIIKESILKHKISLNELYKYKLHKLNNEDVIKITKYLRILFEKLRVMKSKRRIVGVSKSLHFLLPDLVMPMDGKYTMQAFYGNNRYSTNLQKEFEDFMHIFRISVEITEELNLSENDVTGDKWNTSVPKLIDNAIIGFENLRKKRKVRKIQKEN